MERLSITILQLQRSALALGVALAALAALAAQPAAAAIVTGAGGAPVGVQPLAGSGDTGGLMGTLSGPDGGVVNHDGPVLPRHHDLRDLLGSAGAVLELDRERDLDVPREHCTRQRDVRQRVLGCGPVHRLDGLCTLRTDLGGSFVDSDPYPTGGNCATTTSGAPVCVYDSQISSEAASFAASRGLPVNIRLPLHHLHAAERRHLHDGRQPMLDELVLQPSLIRDQRQLDPALYRDPVHPADGGWIAEILPGRRQRRDASTQRQRRLRRRGPQVAEPRDARGDHRPTAQRLV